MWFVDVDVMCVDDWCDVVVVYVCVWVCGELVCELMLYIDCDGCVVVVLDGYVCLMFDCIVVVWNVVVVFDVVLYDVI